MIAQPRLTAEQRTRASRTMLRSACVVAAWIGVEACWIATGSPRQHQDFGLLLDERVREVQGEGRNGWDDLEEAGELYRVLSRSLEMGVESDDGFTVKRPDPTILYGHERPADIHWELELFERMGDRGIDEMVDRAVTAPVMIRPTEGRVDESGLIGMLLPNLANFRHLAKAYVGRMHLAAEAGDDAELIACFERVLVTARACRGQAFIIDALVACAIDAMAIEQLTVLIHEQALGEETCMGLIDAIDRQGWQPPKTLMFEGERAMSLDIVQRMFSDDRHGSGRLSRHEAVGVSSLTGMPPTSMQSVAFGLHANREDTLRLIERFWDAQLQYAALAPIARMGQRSAAMDIMASLGYRDFILQMLLPDVTKILDQVDTARTRRAGLRVLLAIEAWSARHGEPPADLADLVPAFLDEEPADPLHGGPFRYLLLDEAAGGAFNGRRYLLLSTGIDGTLDVDPADLAGATPDEMLKMTETLLAPGGDLILNTVRE